MNAKVYVLQSQPGRNYLPAEDFGEIHVMFPQEDYGHASQFYVDRLHHHFKNLTEKDFVLLSGDPVLIALAGAVAADYLNGNVKFLKWDNQQKRYYPIAIRDVFKSQNP